MNRRDALAALASGTAAVTGCSGLTGPGGVDLAVESVAATPEAVALTTPDSIGTYGSRDSQFLLVEADANGEPLDPGDVGVSVRDRTVRPSTDVGSNYRLWGYGDQFTFLGNLPSDEERTVAGWLPFEVENPIDADGVTIEWPGGERSVDDRTVETLRRPPTTFDVTVDAPAEIESGSAAPISVTVENTGDVDGTFVGALNRIGPSVAYTPETAIELDVPSGEADTWEYSHGAGGTLTFIVRWRAGRQKREITVAGDATDGPTSLDGPG
jgi:hypothetical protein